MANKSLFQSSKSSCPRANATNEAGGPAYRLVPRQALAQLAANGTFRNVFYTSAQDQLAELLSLIDQVADDEFLAKLAIYAREKAFMKDMPAALLVALSSRDTKLMHQVFDRVVDNGRILRTVFQMIRSGKFGRQSLSSSLQRAFQRWLNNASAGKLISASIGSDPSLRDVLRMARPTPKDNERRALFGWLTDKAENKWAPAVAANLPHEVKALEAFRAAGSEKSQAEIAQELTARWDLLADAARGPTVWKAIARQMGPQALRMNLNTLVRQGVFRDGRLEDRGMVEFVAKRLADTDAIRRSRQFPYQFLAAYLNADDQVPHQIKLALHEAAELACGNIPKMSAPVIIGLDASGSMSCPVNGWQARGHRSKMRFVDVAALFAAAILRRNPNSVVIPFDTRAYKAKVDPGDTILSLAERLAGYGGGGTDCSLPLVEANKLHAKRSFAGIVLVSDNQSWVRSGRAYGFGRNGSTGVMSEWDKFKRTQQKNGIADPKLVCIDIAPSGTVQAPDRQDILNVGGFSDAVFGVVSSFLSGDTMRFVSEVESIKLQSN